MKAIALLLFPIFAFSQMKLDRINLPENKGSILAPKELSKMSDSVWTLKYQKRPRPILVLTNKTSEVNLIADMTKQAVPEEQLLSFKDFQVAQLKKGKSDLKVLEDGIKTINGKKVGFIKFVSKVGDQKVFNYYFFCIVEGKICSLLSTV